MKQPRLSAERARELFAYDPETGRLIWRVSKGRAKPGDPAGCPQKGGYLRMRVDQKHYWAHRVVWLHTKGDWPTHFLDHINGDPSDNRVENLREVSRKTNQENQRKPHSNSSTGLLGVVPINGKFRAAISLQGVRTCLGVFTTPEEAHKAYLTAKRELHAGCTI